MTAPAGTEVGIYVDLLRSVATGDVIETQSGRRYLVVRVRVQLRGEHRGRQHLRAVVMEPGEHPPCRGTVQFAPSNRECKLCGTYGQICERSLHRIQWYPRGKARSHR